MIRTTLQFEAPARRVLWCGGVLVALSMGLRQSFGLLMEPLTTTLAIDRSTFSLAIAWQNLMLAFPLVGWLTERLGFRWVGLVGAGLYVVGLWQASSVVASGEFFWWFGLDLGLALSMTTYVVVLGAVGQVVSPSQRGAAFGLITAAGSFGMFALVPLTQGVISVLDWRGSLAAQSVLALLMFGLAWQLPGRGLGHRDPVVTPDQETLPLWETVRGALRDSSYWMLIGGFFVCGFHVAFIATHLPAFLREEGVEGWASATALSLIGLFNIGGSLWFGRLGDRWRKRHLLSVLYLLRAVVIGSFLWFPLHNTTALLFGASIGFLWLATVPLTSGLVAQMFGVRHLSMLYGLVFLGHQVGASLGVWLGGVVYDQTGSYEPVWIGAIVLSLLSATLHVPVRDHLRTNADLQPRPLGSV